MRRVGVVAFAVVAALSAAPAGAQDGHAKPTAAAPVKPAAAADSHAPSPNPKPASHAAESHTGAATEKVEAPKTAAPPKAGPGPGPGPSLATTLQRIDQRIKDAMGEKPDEYVVVVAPRRAAPAPRPARIRLRWRIGLDWPAEIGGGVTERISLSWSSPAQ